MYGAAVGQYGSRRGFNVVGRGGVERPSTYGAGRVCAAEACVTILSAYNPSDVCCLHEGWTARCAPSTRQFAPREELTRTCLYERCGREFVTTNPAKKFCSDRCRLGAFQARRAVEGRHATAG